jgi:hypothetical protein
VVAEVRKTLAVNKQASQSFDVERFNLRKPNELEVRKQYQIEISNRLPALETFSDIMDMNRIWEHIKEGIKTSAKGSLVQYKLKQHKLRSDKECS